MTAPVLPRGASSRGASSRGAGSLAARLGAEQASLRSRSLAASVLAVIAVLAVAAAAGALLLSDGRWLAWPRLVPVLLWVAAAACAVLVARLLRARDAAVLTIPSLAGAIEREQSLRAGSLRGALEVADTGTLGAFAAQSIAKRLAPASLAPQLTQRLMRALGLAAAAAVIGAALLTLSARTSSDGFAAVVHPIRAFRGTLLTPLAFDNLPPSVPRGMPLTVRVRAEGRQAITVSQRAAGEAWRDTTLDVDATTGMAMLALGPVRAPVTLRVQDGRALDAEATIRVDERGWIGDIALFAQYPAYLGRTSETIEPVSPIRVPRGTRLRVTAMLRGGARDAKLTDGVTAIAVRESGTSPAASTNGVPATGEIVLDHDGTWTWAAS
ncbi:MAG: hypothetical protein ABMA00_12925, partial [Gemmatimonas sp.]